MLKQQRKHKKKKETRDSPKKGKKKNKKSLPHENSQHALDDGLPTRKDGCYPRQTKHVGDSFVLGAGDPDCRGWPGRICSAARHGGRDLTGYNLGIRRDTSAEIRRRWPTEAASRLPPGPDGRLVFSFGVNDCVREDGAPRVSPAAMLDNARAILSTARTTHPTLMLGPPPTTDAELDRAVAALSDRLAALCAELAIPFLPLFPLLAGHPVWQREAAAGDGIHPGAGGYTLIAEAVLGWNAWQDWIAQAPRL